MARPLCAVRRFRWDDALPACWKDFVDALDAGIDRVVLYGPSGTGKTYAALREGVGHAGRAPARLHRGHDGRGRDGVLDADGVGAVRVARRRGACARGVATAPAAGGSSSTRPTARRATCSRCCSRCATPTARRGSTTPRPGRCSRRSTGFTVVMTTNLEHPEELPAALRDRFPVAIEIDAPHPDAVDAAARGPPRRGDRDHRGPGAAARVAPRVLRLRAAPRVRRAGPRGATRVRRGAWRGDRRRARDRRGRVERGERAGRSPSCSPRGATVPGPRRWLVEPGAARRGRGLDRPRGAARCACRSAAARTGGSCAPTSSCTPG